MEKDIFCILPKDEKTFNLLKVYLSTPLDERDLFMADNTVQMMDLEEHLKSHNIPKDFKAEEEVSWVTKNSHGWRIYINSIKLLLINAKIDEHNWKKTLTWEFFCDIVDKYNSMYEPILKNIRS